MTMKDLLKDNSGIGRGNGILSASIGVQAGISLSIRFCIWATQWKLTWALRMRTRILDACSSNEHIFLPVLFIT